MLIATWAVITRTWGMPYISRRGDSMPTEIVVALITGGVTLAGVLASNSRAHAVVDEKIAELTREVRKHNNFAERMPVVEEQIKVINHRIQDLEDKQ